MCHFKRAPAQWRWATLLAALVAIYCAWLTALVRLSSNSAEAFISERAQLLAPLPLEKPLRGFEIKRSPFLILPGFSEGEELGIWSNAARPQIMFKAPFLSPELSEVTLQLTIRAAPFKQDYPVWVNVHANQLKLARIALAPDSIQQTLITLPRAVLAPEKGGPTVLVFEIEPLLSWRRFDTLLGGRWLGIQLIELSLHARPPG